MRTIIAGSREISDYLVVCFAIDAAGLIEDIIPTTVLSGCARGVDRLGEQAAVLAGWDIELHPADWKRFGKRAGYVRNVEMADSADALIAVWNGSPGTEHMIDIARARGLKVYVHLIDSPKDIE